MTLRERLEALAGVMCDSGYGDEYDRKCLALAAARMALEDAARLCEAHKSEYEGLHWTEADGPLEMADSCAQSIRAAADGLE